MENSNKNVYYKFKEYSPISYLKRNLIFSFEKNYSYDISKEFETVLYSYNNCYYDDSVDYLSFLDEFFENLDNLDFKVKNFIIDLSLNSGGISNVINPFILKLDDFIAKNKEMKISLIIGRDTVSSGLEGALIIRNRYNNVKVYGERTGGGVDSGSLYQTLLPNSKIIYNYSISYEKRSFYSSVSEEEKEKNTMIPDIEFEITEELLHLETQDFISKVIRMNK